MTEIFYDAGLLIAADRGNREALADHRVRLELGLLPRTTAPVAAQVSRAPTQAQLHRLLRGCVIEEFGAEVWSPVGSLLGRAHASDVVDAHLVFEAARREATVLTSDPGDLEQLAAALVEGKVTVLSV